MALQKEYYDNRLDVTIADCYWKIGTEEGIIGGKLLLKCKLLCYKNSTHADTNTGEYGRWKFEFTPDLGGGINFIAQAYGYIKTSIPEFDGAIDV